jgi:hypothetical protein
MILPYMVKCNCTGPRYLYWSGVHWTTEIARAAHYATKKAANDAIRDLHPPRIMDRKDRGPEAFTLDVSKTDD